MKKTLQFKTNINCASCIKAVTPSLDKLAGSNNWEVNTKDPEKILSVHSDILQAEDIINTVRAVGYTIENQNK